MVDKLILSERNTLRCYDILMDAYADITDIEQYQRIRKGIKLLDMESYDIFGNHMYSDIYFNDYDMSPMDMDIRLEYTPENREYYNQLQYVSSFVVGPTPGRSLCVKVWENNTKKLLGFIKMSSPTINMKPRNTMLDYVIKPEELNRTFYNGIVIVPVQPFGFNYLGGKLLALIAASTDIRDRFNNKYDTDIQYFETTSLYGSIKQSSQYDGLKPIIKRSKVRTDSNLMMYPSDDVIKKLTIIIKSENEGNHVVNITVNSSSVKTKRFNGLIRTIKNSLKHHDIDKYHEFSNMIKTKSNITTKKNYYYCNNISKSSEEMISIWKKKSVKRWEKLRSEDRLKKDLEVWSLDNIHTDDIQMIR